MKKNMLHVALFIIVISIVVFVIIFLNKKDYLNNTNETNKNMVKNTTEEKSIEYTTAKEIIESNEINQIRDKVKLDVPVNFYMLPIKLNGKHCNTINYNSFFDEYNHEYDGIISDIPKDTEIKLTSEIIKQIINVKLDNMSEIKDIEHEKTDKMLTVKVQESGRYIIECELEKDTVVNIVFEIFVTK